MTNDTSTKLIFALFFVMEKHIPGFPKMDDFETHTHWHEAVTAWMKEHA